MPVLIDVDFTAAVDAAPRPVAAARQLLRVDAHVTDVPVSDVVVALMCSVPKNSRDMTATWRPN